MTATNLNSLVDVGLPKAKGGLRWQLAASHPTALFLLLTFAWSWVILLSAIPLKGQNQLLIYVLALMGGYGPALAGILTTGLKNGLTIDLPRKRVIGLAAGFALILSLLAIRLFLGKISGYDALPADLTLTAPIAAAAIAASLLGGWVISSAFSANLDIRSRMVSLLPTRRAAKWAVAAFAFYAVMLVASWGICALAGIEIEYPGMWGRPAVEVAPLFLLAFLLTALARGGMEEPGWRGTMLPGLQNRLSPLAASLIITLFWSLWHLPFFLNGFYSGDVVSGMIGGAILRVFLSIFLTWFYNRAGGNLLTMVILHTSFNMYVDFIPTNDLVLMVLWLVVVVGIVLKDKMYRRLPNLPAAGSL